MSRPGFKCVICHKAVYKDKPTWCCYQDGDGNDMLPHHRACCGVDTDDGDAKTKGAQTLKEMYALIRAVSG